MPSPALSFLPCDSVSSRIAGRVKWFDFLIWWKLVQLFDNNGTSTLDHLCIWTGLLQRRTPSWTATLEYTKDLIKINLWSISVSSVLERRWHPGGYDIQCHQFPWVAMWCRISVLFQQPASLPCWGGLCCMCVCWSYPAGESFLSCLLSASHWLTDCPLIPWSH